MEFPNGKMLSVKFGAGNYCSNYAESFDTKIKDSYDAEIAVIDTNLPHRDEAGKRVSQFISLQGDDVTGRCSVRDVANLIAILNEDGDLNQWRKI